MLRAGATLVGPTGAGKSTCYRILSRIMTSLHKAGSKNEQYQEVAFEILNPKCITMGELYGPYLRVLRCCGAFTSFKRIVSIRRRRGWFLFRVWGRSDAAAPSTES